MKLHIFNPEHDLALAYDNHCITPPHAIQEFKNNLSFLPALWADDGDCILTDNIPFALKSLKQIHKPHADVLFLNACDIKNLLFTEICPWGWNRNIKALLKENGINDKLLPSDDLLLNIRALSSRKETTSLLCHLRSDIEHKTCGESFFIDNPDNLEPLLEHYNHIVVKAPWSSSGRGVRYIDKENVCPSIKGWIRNIIKSQGGIMAEPYYNRLKDFAMEFYSHGNGRIDYRGLSIFSTEKGCYTGNIIAPEVSKKTDVCRYIDENILLTVQHRITDYFSKRLQNIYRGYFGVDMMVVAGNDNNGYLLHPCVEVNLRMTMGHVANSIPCPADKPEEIMKIVHDVNYKLKFEPLENNFVKVI